ncbi:MAG TPA: S8 family serine peptidase, partial [Egibacteraceae bacterium]|nr:S8 family serine peptidase [Egibacteraceae bacterium]
VELPRADHPHQGVQGVRAAVPDRPVRLRHEVDGYDPSADPHALHALVRVIGARQFYDEGWTGAGVDVALIDSGVAAVAGLDQPGGLLHGPDLSFESQSDALRHVDTFGHGTHMAGIIAGRDAGVTVPRAADHHAFHGVAPGARVVSLKVADRNGATDVSQVIAAIDWVVQHRDRAGLRIRVLNLSFGTDAVQDYRIDPLAHAAEVAWRNGIVVVAAAGNAGTGSPALDNPALDPFLLAVGAQDTRGTQGLGDDVVPAFSSTGDGVRNPDLVAPGVSVASLRVPDSGIDRHHPGGRVGSRYFRGSGTSQAAAVVSGAVALLLQRHPGLTPDEVKQHLRASAEPLPAADPRGQGSGALDLEEALRRPPQLGARQPWEPSSGAGSLDGARGSLRLSHDDVVLDGEQDIFGAPFDAAAHARLAEAGTAWSDGDWNGGPWTGAGWLGDRWAATVWSRSSWSRSSWSSGGWTRSSWTRSSWSGDAWAGGGWG